MQIQAFVMENRDMLMLTGMLLLICLSAVQCVKTAATSRHLKFLTRKLAAYLQTVLETDEESDEAAEEEIARHAAEYTTAKMSDTAPEYAEPVMRISRQEQNMRERIELQKQQKKERESQLLDAVLADVFS